MQATHGSAVSFRTRGRLIGTLMVFALAFSALVFAPQAANAQAPPTTTYLALGDSISFGYSEERFNIHYPTESPSYFEEGFTNGFAKDLRSSSEVGKSIRLVNDACPGETSNGLIGEDPALGGEVSTESIEEVERAPSAELPAGGYQGLGDWHPCKYTFVDHLPLHNGGYFNPETRGEVSQLEEAVATIESGAEVKAITVNIGSNDELAAITQCEDEFDAKGEAAVPPGCIKQSAEDVTIPHVLKNLGDIIGVLDGVGYKGPIILLGFYNPDAMVLPGSDALQEGLNAAVETYVVPSFPNVTYANPFPVFNKGAVTETESGNAKMEQKAICKWTEMCNPNDPGGSAGDGDIHPSVKGYKELAKLVNEAYLANPAS